MAKRKKYERSSSKLQLLYGDRVLNPRLNGFIQNSLRLVRRQTDRSRSSDGDAQRKPMDGSESFDVMTH